MLLRWLLGLHLVLAAGIGFAAEISGIVTAVHDGDTFTLTSSEQKIEVRLVDIDAPELDQPRGKDARVNLFRLCAAKQVTVETHGKDRFRRTLGRVTCDGMDANTEMVRRGWAWVSIRYAPKDSPLFALEREARLGKLGLWADDDPMPPWEWRAKKREK